MTEASTFFLWRLPSWKVSIESLGSFVTAEACVSGLGGLSGFVVLIQAAFDWPQLPVEASCSAQEQSILAIVFSSLREMLQQHFFINKASWKRFWKGAGMHSTSSQKISFNGPLTTPSHVLLASCSKQWLDQKLSHLRMSPLIESPFESFLHQSPDPLLALILRILITHRRWPGHAAE